MIQTKGKTQTPDRRIIIEGVTLEGRIFRPSDWPERLSGRMASFKNQRMVYSPLLHPGVKDGRKCLIIHVKLKSINPEMFAHVIEFAQLNHLNIFEEPTLT